MNMFGFDLSKMLGGDGEGDGKGGGGFIMNMIMKQLAAPGTQKMLADKADEMFAHTAQQVNCKQENVSFLIKQELLPATNEKGLVMEENAEGVAVQKLEKRVIIYVMDGGKAVQKIELSQFLSMMNPATAG
jgi:hypothetical protein